ncbi:uncharacterized protein LOC123505111 isoform X2 [Portunus trituberculatus]|uniref:uncharacterized protein LOC123505111 isoform X2 n=1 Tax=Portunus trituberculatus TaxID=210409 RepID=UPI001E1D18E5|nr:uncharacterized protein LOC123505111 isoform X2 [Portunus trituberculatus]
MGHHLWPHVDWDISWQVGNPGQLTFGLWWLHVTDVSHVTVNRWSPLIPHQQQGSVMVQGIIAAHKRKNSIGGPPTAYLTQRRVVVEWCPAKVCRSVLSCAISTSTHITGASQGLCCGVGSPRPSMKAQARGQAPTTPAGYPEGSCRTSRGVCCR